MPLNFESQTPDSINERMAADVKLSAPKSNPTKKNSFLYSLVKGLAFRVYDFYQILGKVKRESFPDTSSIDGELSRWGGYKKITIKPITGATGTVIATGDVGKKLPKETKASLGDVTYQTDYDVEIQKIKYVAKRVSRNASVVTFVTTSQHNLSSSLNVTVSGAELQEANGEFEISVISATEFTYTIEGADSSSEVIKGGITGAFDIAFVSVQVSEDSKKTGAISNQGVGTSLKIDDVVEVDPNLLVSFNGIAGGADAETADLYRERVLDAYANPVAQFNESSITQVIRQNVANATRVWVRACTPQVGQVTIYFTADNQSVIPTGQDIKDAKAAVLTILPVNTPTWAAIVKAPTPKRVKFVFADIEPNTAAMRTEIEARLKELFYIESNVGETLRSEVFRSTISATIDSEGKSLTNFSLEEPIADIVLDESEIIVLDEVTFANRAGEVFLDNMFDGLDNRSNGRDAGNSKVIDGSNSSLSIDIILSGPFDGAVVTLQQYDNEFKDTTYSWTTSGEITGLTVIDTEFRLVLRSPGGSTNISAKALYS